jgi:hypothetical protein
MKRLKRQPFKLFVNLIIMGLLRRRQIVQQEPQKLQRLDLIIDRQRQIEQPF